MIIIFPILQWNVYLHANVVILESYPTTVTQVYLRDDFRYYHNLSNEIGKN